MPVWCLTPNPFYKHHQFNLCPITHYLPPITIISTHPIIIICPITIILSHHHSHLSQEINVKQFRKLDCSPSCNLATSRPSSPHLDRTSHRHLSTRNVHHGPFDFMRFLCYVWERTLDLCGERVSSPSRIRVPIWNLVGRLLLFEHITNASNGSR